ncbi:MAG: TRAP transporter permease DctM/Q [Dehalococcoidales bacterium]|jgi:tripartite ATP-independent transporter DctM subunit|nr:TRAP transporter permease DctM/Q [Dehalococcoidales bacterium]|tara:strand:- start:177 stop:1490 length:1314 start_codon:yes stop_codon:yes gene_type:complete
MSIEVTTLIIVAALLILVATGFPVAFSLLAVAVFGIFVLYKPAALFTLASVTQIASTTDFFIAVPMFIFMAAVLQVSGVGSALYETMYKWMAGLRGGLAMGTVVISTIMAAMTGVAATATVTMGLLSYPEMRKRGYNKNMAIGCIPAGGCLGPLIPPSIPMIIVAGLSSISIGKLFFAGVFPGFLTSFCFIAYIGVRCFLNPAVGPPIPVDKRATWRERFASLRGVVLPIGLIILVLGTIYTGIATPSEAGGVGAFGALICAAIYRNFNWKNMKEAVLTSLRVNAMVFWLILGGSMFSVMLGLTGVKDFIAELLVGSGATPWVILILMLFIVYLMGMFMDATAIAIICIPVFAPIVQTLGFDMLWFGFIFTMDMLIGFITPPFGVNLFYFKGLGHEGVTMTDIYQSVLPFVVLITIAWIICVIFPPIATWLPNQMIQ